MGLASRGLRDLGQGLEPITDPHERAAVRAQAMGVTGKSLAAALVVGALLLSL